MTTDAEVERTRDEYRALSSADLERRLDLKEIGEPGSWQITVALAVLEEKNRHGRLQLLQKEDERAGTGAVCLLMDAPSSDQEALGDSSPRYPRKKPSPAATRGSAFAA